MRTRVAFHRLNATTSDYGGTSGGYDDTAFLTVWGNLYDLIGRENVEAGGLENPQRAILEIRYSASASGVTEADQVRAGSRTYQIRSIVNVDERNRTIRMALERGVGQ